MARNLEKQAHYLNRFIKEKNRGDRKEAFGQDPNATRPFLATRCDSVIECEKWRMDIIHEISEKVSDIQNSGLGEYRLREMNDEINKLLREKWHWEKQIQSLGGKDYRLEQRKHEFLYDGKEAAGAKGYKYFGAAKDLPGVKELFEKHEAGPQRRTRFEMMKNVTPDYYGWRDDEDGLLEPIERKAERKARKQASKEYDEMQAAKKARKEAGLEVAVAGGVEEEDTIQTAEELQGMASHVVVPSQQSVKDQVLAKRKAELIKKWSLDKPNLAGGAKTAPAAPIPVVAEDSKGKGKGKGKGKENPWAYESGKKTKRRPTKED